MMLGGIEDIVLIFQMLLHPVQAKHRPRLCISSFCGGESWDAQIFAEKVSKQLYKTIPFKNESFSSGKFTRDVSFLLFLIHTPTIFVPANFLSSVSPVCNNLAIFTISLFPETLSLTFLMLLFNLLGDDPLLVFRVVFLRVLNFSNSIRAVTSPRARSKKRRVKEKRNI